MKHLLIAALCLLATDALAQTPKSSPSLTVAPPHQTTAPRRLAASVGVTTSKTINITVTGAFPDTVSCNPSAPALPSNAPAGTLACALSATMADGSPFIGTFGVSGAAGIFTLGADGKSIVTARALTRADIASSPFTLTMSATQ